MSYEWAMTPIKDLRISSDNMGINAYYKDEAVSISWKEVFDAADLYRLYEGLNNIVKAIPPELMIKELETYGYKVIKDLPEEQPAT